MMRSLVLEILLPLLFAISMPMASVAFLPATSTTATTSTSRSTSSSTTTAYMSYGYDQKTGIVTYPEKEKATYELSKVFIPFEFGDASFVRPLLKQTQLETRKLQVVYDANKHGYDAKTFHQKVDGKGASIVLAKTGLGHYFGGYNPRGWASLGGSRPSVASFLFYKTLFGWEKFRSLGQGGMACSRDEFDSGIFFGAEGLQIPLNGQDPRTVASRLGTYFESKDGKSTLLPKAGGSFRLAELKVLVGVYDKDEIIPNSGGVTDLGLY